MLTALFVLALLSAAAYLLSRRLLRESRLGAIDLIAELRARLGLQTMADLQRAAADAVCRAAPVMIDHRHLPNDVLVLLHPDERKRMGELAGAFCDGIATLMEAAVKNGARDGGLPYKMLSEPRVRLKADPRVRRGTVGIVATVAELTRLRTPELSEGSLLELNLGGERTPLEGELLVGRGVDADVRLEGEEVSREQALLRCRGMEVLVKDLGTANGTWVNGERIKEARLKVGDRIRFGGGTAAVIEFSSRARQTIYRNTEPLRESPVDP